MDYKTHIVGGVGLAYATTQIIPIEPKQILIFYGCCVLGSILPDIDHPEAFIGRRIPLISILIYKTVGHRTFTHSLLFAICAAAIGMFFSVYAGLGLFLGIVSHVLLDLLTPEGVAYLYPFIKGRIKLTPR